MKLKSWRVLEEHVASRLNLRKTIGSGAVFGDGDLIGKINNIKFTIECKYTESKKLRLKFNDYYKALVQSENGKTILIIGSPTLAYVFCDLAKLPINNRTGDFFKGWSVQGIDNKTKSFTIDTSDPKWLIRHDKTSFVLLEFETFLTMLEKDRLTNIKE